MDSKVLKWLFCLLLPWFLTQIFYISAYESYEYWEYESDGSHRSRRSVSVSNTPPQPTAEFPVVLFSDLSYNNESSGYYHRLRQGEFCVWGSTIDNRVREFRFRSMLSLPNTTVTFQACCPSGQTFVARLTNICNISNIHLWMFDHPEAGGSQGTFYTSWVHWKMDFSIRPESCQSNCNSLPCNGECYFGSCGTDGTCQCASGYSGEKCETRPAESDNFPTIQYPLFLFPEKKYKGTPLKVAPDTNAIFAENRQTKKNIKYNSLRVLYDWKLTFSRSLASATTVLAPGSDIEDIESFMVNNPNLVADKIWFNYANDLELDFVVKVEDVPSCTNCSTTGGCCYSRTCLCLPGYTGVNCETSV